MAQIQPIERQVDRLVARFNRVAYRSTPLAISWSLNRTLDMGTTALSTNLAARLKLPKGRVQKRLYKTRSTAKTLNARLRVYERGVMAISLPGVRDKGRYKKGKRGRTGTGVSARRGYRWADAFIAKGLGNNVHVFRRKPNQKLEAIDINVKAISERLAKPTLNRVMQRELPRIFAADLQRRVDNYFGK